MFASYNRLNVSIYDSDRTVIRACRVMMNIGARRDRTRREARHSFYRSMLEYHRKALELAAQWRL